MCFPFPRLPVELQHSIVMMLKDKHDVHRYAHIAKWTYALMYHTVRLWHERIAITLLMHIKECIFAQHVADLYIRRSVTIHTTVEIIRLCQNLTILTLKFPLHYITNAVKNPLLAPLNGLQKLKILYMLLASMPLDHYINLLDFERFRHISHLHLGSSLGAEITIPQGLTSLLHLTHLSLHWSISRYCALNLRAFLSSDLMVILIIWMTNCMLELIVKCNLTLQGLANSQVVLFRVLLMAEYISDGDFWGYSELIMKWRHANEGECWNSPLQISMH
ncbi:hypothetical protein L210DRAFT_870476 [Boletus edulis BED1]|uniref:F-box domain-containing protein n=1 Tax=Boletus edulis BED1 TaxID=1328754 RepID=A0AAD4BVP8_BOLED|nr:hypothetical protein L210DRAFT_870476 [Boletus edulis BED1]